MNQYHEIAYEHLGLSEDGHNVGTMRLIDLPEKVLEYLCARRLDNVDEVLFPERGFFDPRLSLDAQKISMENDAPWRDEVRNNYFLTYSQYTDFLKVLPKYEGVYNPRASYEERRNTLVRRYFIRAIYRPDVHKPNLAGWKKYLQEASPKFYEALAKPVHVRIPEKARLAHNYIVAKSQSGKSEYMKLLIHSYLTMPDYCAVLLLDPAGDFALEVAQQKDNLTLDRLIYIDPALDLSRTPTINPFEIHGVSFSDRSKEAVKEKENVAEQIVEALQDVFSQGQSDDVSSHMENLLYPCILTLLNYPNASFEHLHTFMKDKENDPLVEFARSLTHHPHLPKYFAGSFQEKSLTPTKNAVIRRLDAIFNRRLFQQLTSGASTISLEEAWNQKKIIICNLAKGEIGSYAAQAFGRLVVCLLQGIALRRVRTLKENRIPLHLFCDEMENFTSNTMAEIMRFSAKFRLLWTGSQQIVGSGLSGDQHKAFIGNSHIKIAGATDNLYFKSEADLFHIEPSEIGKLSVGHFYCRIGNNPPFRFATYKHLLGKNNAMSDAEWKRVKTDQLRRYYRPLREERQTVIELPEIKGPPPPSPPPTMTLPIKDFEGDMKPAPWKRKETVP